MRKQQPYSQMKHYFMWINPEFQPSDIQSSISDHYHLILDMYGANKFYVSMKQ